MEIESEKKVFVDGQDAQTNSQHVDHRETTPVHDSTVEAESIQESTPPPTDSNHHHHHHQTETPTHTHHTHSVTSPCCDHQQTTPSHQSPLLAVTHCPECGHDDIAPEKPRISKGMGPLCVYQAWRCNCGTRRKKGKANCFECPKCKCNCGNGASCSCICQCELCKCQCNIQTWSDNKRTANKIKNIDYKRMKLDSPSRLPDAIELKKERIYYKNPEKEKEKAALKEQQLQQQLQQQHQQQHIHDDVGHEILSKSMTPPKDSHDRSEAILISPYREERIKEMAPKNKQVILDLIKYKDSGKMSQEEVFKLISMTLNMYASFEKIHFLHEVLSDRPEDFCEICKFLVKEPNQQGHPQHHQQQSHQQESQEVHPQESQTQESHPQDSHPQDSHPQEVHPQESHPQESLQEAQPQES